MKPERNSRRYFGITRSQGKMYELGVPEGDHIAIPADVDAAALFPLTVGTLVDAAAAILDADEVDQALAPDEAQDLDFAARFFDAYLSSHFNDAISGEVLLLASAAYLLVRRPGSSLVLARRHTSTPEDGSLPLFTHWLLKGAWEKLHDFSHPVFGDLLQRLALLVQGHFTNGSSIQAIAQLSGEVRAIAHDVAASRDLVWAEIALAVIRMRLDNSSWTKLPALSALDVELWRPAITKLGFPKELWPSQKLLGRAGLFSGRSGVVQMPTSAGKTRSVEMILRSAFMSERSKVAVVVAPFRALCHEIAATLRAAFLGEDIKVNELTDALQLDFTEQLFELLGEAVPASKYVLALTPEKLLYVLRQEPSLIQHIGLIVYDEGHQFDTGSRGITYELLLTEIKTLLNPAAQTVLISAVIKNAHDVGEWLIGEDPNVVDGAGLLSTSRAVAFASWLENLGRLEFFEGALAGRPDYFVPRTIEAHDLQLQGKERKTQQFPKRGDEAWKDVSLYLGLRLCGNGATAVFCGRKDTATGLATRAVNVFGRGLDLPVPADQSDPQEIGRMVRLSSEHFGADATTTQSAQLGVFVHHGTTPQGMRLAIEHAMQQELIKLVICTSTLAQGVNLPIRYLIVSGVHQGADRIKTRDFQNLIGRAGRAGMHTEGTVIFADPKVWDRRRAEDWRLRGAADLLNRENAEDTSSSLLGLVAPIHNSQGNRFLPLTAYELLELFFMAPAALAEWAARTAARYARQDFDAKDLVKEVARRKRLLASVESYLMANRGQDDSEAFLLKVKQLAESTLAYAMGTEEQQALLNGLFTRVATHIDATAPNADRQSSYAKTLQGVEDAVAIESWTRANEAALKATSTHGELLTLMWPLLIQIVDDKLLRGMQPDGLALEIATAWMEGRTYADIIQMAMGRDGTKPWGDDRVRRLTDADILEYVEGLLGFDAPLVVAAVSQFLFEAEMLPSDEAEAMKLFQKSLKYGLPDPLAISAFEYGLADRVIAQATANALRAAGYGGSNFAASLGQYRQTIQTAVEPYPAYFNELILL